MIILAQILMGTLSKESRPGVAMALHSYVINLRRRRDRRKRMRALMVQLRLMKRTRFIQAVDGG